MKRRITLHAEDGMVLTDGVNYGTVIHLAAGADANKYYEISKEEYEKIVKSEETNNE